MHLRRASARVRIEARSEPASGSEKPCAHVSVPSKKPGNTRAKISGGPNARRVGSEDLEVLEGRHAADAVPGQAVPHDRPVQMVPPSPPKASGQPQRPIPPPKRSPMRRRIATIRSSVLGPGGRGLHEARRTALEPALERCRKGREIGMVGWSRTGQRRH